MDPQIEHMLRQVARRFQSHRLAWYLTGFWIAVGLAIAAGVIPLPRAAMLGRRDGWYLGILALILGLLWMASRLAFRDLKSIAERVELQYPTLEQRLLTATASSASSASSSYFRKRLAQETISHGRAFDWTQTLAPARLYGAWMVQWVAFSLLVLWIVSGARPIAALTPSREALGLSTFSGNEWVVSPGDVEIERGADLLVTARFQGNVPDGAIINTRNKDGDEKSLPMIRALSDPLFGGSLRSVNESLHYHVVAGGRSSPSYSVKVFEFPTLVRSDAHIEPPSYAGQRAKTVENTRRVTVSEGTRLTWVCTLNKSVATAELIDENGQVTSLEARPEDSKIVSATFELVASHKWRLRLVDAEGRSAKLEETFAARVLPNKPAQIKVSNPSDQRVSPLQELLLGASFSDDHGIAKAGISYHLSGQDAQEHTLVEQTDVTETNKKLEVSFPLALEERNAQPDQLLSYFFWIEDLDAEGNVRRVDGEMFFAEVRPFEEQFRQGDQGTQPASQSSPSMPSQAGEMSEELGELQKKIISATWNGIREFQQLSIAQRAENAGVIRESQQKAREQSDAIAEQLTSEASAEVLKQVQQSMESAIQKLTEASSDATNVSLREALDNERKAYEGLLRLRAREFNLTQSQSSQSQSQSQSAGQRNRQQQLEQLKLEDDPSRYESESRPESNEANEQREARQVMNRLEELARRQQDLNEQMRDLEMALREAATEEKKQELEEQLQRLRDNQEELLRDTDELLDRMNQEANQDAMQESRQRMEDVRNQMQQSAESLQQQQTSSALSAGSRAQQTMEETRESLRQQSSQGLQQSMRSLLDQVDTLDKKQQELQSRLPNQSPDNTPETDAPNPSMLRPEQEAGAESDLADAWKEQRQNLERVLESIKETVTESESSEPVLAESLYDTYREAMQNQVGERLTQTSELLRRGFDAPATQTGQEATEGIRELREQLERSAESVLGSEQQALARAVEGLERAQEQIEQEMNQRTGRDPEDSENERAQNSGDARTSKGDDAGDRKDAESPPREPNGLANREDSQNREGQENRGDRESRGGQENRDPAADRGEENPNARASQSQQDEQSASGQPSTGQDQQEGNPQNQDGTQGGAQDADNRSQRNGEQSTGGNGRGDRARGASGLDQVRSESEFVAPLTGDDFNAWTDAIREVEELVRDPDLKAEAARIREAARDMRVDFKRHAKAPEWPLVQRLITEPMEQLRQKISQELIRKSAERNQIIPLDRDPVPNQFRSALDKYFEQLGAGVDTDAR